MEVDGFVLEGKSGRRVRGREVFLCGNIRHSLFSHVEGWESEGRLQGY